MFRTRMERKQFHIFLYLAMTCSAEPVHKIETTTDLNDYCSTSPGCPDAGSNMQCLVETGADDCWYARHDLMTDEFIDYIIKRVNDERFKMGSQDSKDRLGASKELPQAKIMHVVQWDEDLAIIAHTLADRCDKNIDGMQTYLKSMCTTTDRFPHPKHIGEYSADTFVYRKQQVITPENAQEEVIRKKIDKWFDARIKTEPTNIEQYPDDPTSENDIFLNFMNGETTHIGCHLSTYKSSSIRDPNNQKPDMMDLQCYASRNLTKDQPVYCIDEKNENCKCQYGYHKKLPNDFRCYPDKEKCQGSACRPIVLVMPIVQEVNPPSRKLTTKPPVPSRRFMVTPNVPIYNDSLRYNLQQQVLQRYLPQLTPKPKPVISRREFSNLRRMIQEYMSKKRGSRQPSSTTALPVKVSQRFKFDDVDRLIGAIRTQAANKTS